MLLYTQKGLTMLHPKYGLLTELIQTGHHLDMLSGTGNPLILTDKKKNRAVLLFNRYITMLEHSTKRLRFFSCDNYGMLTEQLTLGYRTDEEVTTINKITFTAPLSMLLTSYINRKNAYRASPLTVAHWEIQGTVSRAMQADTVDELSPRIIKEIVSVNSGLLNDVFRIRISY